jgi:hypothetical protein
MTLLKYGEKFYDATKAEMAKDAGSTVSTEHLYEGKGL